MQDLLSNLEATNQAIGELAQAAEAVRSDFEQMGGEPLELFNATFGANAAASMINTQAIGALKGMMQG